MPSTHEKGIWLAKHRKEYDRINRLRDSAHSDERCSVDSCDKQFVHRFDRIQREYWAEISPASALQRAR